MTHEYNTSYFLRLASFKPLSLNDIRVSCLLLASHGYYYTGHDLEIKCQACGTKAHICQDNSNFQDELKHKRGCHFNEGNEEELTGLSAQAVAASSTGKVIEFDGESDKPAYFQNYIKDTFSSDDATSSSNILGCVVTHYHDDIEGTTFCSDGATVSNKSTCVTTDSHSEIKDTIFPSDDYEFCNKPAWVTTDSHSEIKDTIFPSDDYEFCNKPAWVTTDSHNGIKDTTLLSDEATEALTYDDFSEAYTYDDTSPSSLFVSETYTASEAQRDRMMSTSSSSSRSSGYHSDTSNESGETSSSECTTFLNGSLADYYDFSELFSPESFWFNSSKRVNDLDFNGQHCDKNPGHFSYFPWISLKLEQIPSAFRFSEMSDLLKLMGELTVRITVSNTSKLRPREGLTRVNGCKTRIGTGFAIEHACHIKKSHGSEPSKYKNIKRWFRLGRKKDIGYVYIQTSRHLVFDDEEAQNAVVEFFYDTHDANDVITLDGKFLLTSSTDGDNQCLLVCECSDLGFIHKINQLQREFVGVAHRLPLKAKKRMSKKMFMIHHPHGGPKVLSYGDYVRLKYRFNMKGRCRATLTKLTADNQDSREVNMYRKALFYATETCPGSCGAPILTFFSRPPDVNNVINYKLDLWTHTGVETTHNLGVSVLKVCTLDDIYQHRPEGAQGGRLSNTEEDSEDEDSLGQQKVNSPVYKVLNAPCHPEYSLFQTRLDSYIEWTYMPSPYSLASNGFFYTGDTDCVRCFQCGLGLRSWKQGDDVLTQHEKFRPTCPFLMSLAKRGLNAITEAIADSGISPEDEEVQMLETENRTLKQRLVCKICSKSEIKDVFLPCGELYACSECSKLLTHCPSCKKQILATVTIYLT